MKLFAERTIRVQMSRSEKVDIFKTFLEDEPSEYLKMHIASGAGEIGGLEGAGILQELLRHNPSNEALRSIASGAGEIGGLEGAGILQELLRHNPSNEALRSIAVEAGKIGGPEGAGILQELLRHNPSNEALKKSIAFEAGEIGGPEGAGILQELLRLNPSSTLKSIIARQTQELYIYSDARQKQQVRLMLQNLSRDKDVDDRVKAEIQELFNLAENMTAIPAKR